MHEIKNMIVSVNSFRSKIKDKIIYESKKAYKK